MKKTTLALLLILLFATVQTFAQDAIDDSTQVNADQMELAGRKFMLSGDYANAVLVLNRGTILYPENIEMIKDLAMSYYLQKNFDQALKTIQPLVLDRSDADDEAYQIAGNIYQELRMFKDCEKLYKKGLKEFPTSGPLYNELGELLWNEKDDNSIVEWEAGIKADPSYPKNYYNACRWHYYSGDFVWSILYGEIFVNMDPNNTTTPEIKTAILESYKKLFAMPDMTKDNREQTPFVAAYLSIMSKQSKLAAMGLTAETLTMIRTRFLLDWYKQYSSKYPYHLFDWEHQLTQQGMFDAYDQWMFATVDNLPAYQAWVNAHYDEYSAFNSYQKDRIFKFPLGQYYK